MCVFVLVWVCCVCVCECSYMCVHECVFVEGEGGVHWSSQNIVDVMFMVWLCGCENTEYQRGMFKTYSMQSFMRAVDDLTVTDSLVLSNIVGLKIMLWLCMKENMKEYVQSKHSSQFISWKSAWLFARYWYFGPLKHHWTYIRTAMKEWPPTVKAKVTYVEATPENMKVTESDDDEQPQKASWSFMRFLFGKKQIVAGERVMVGFWLVVDRNLCMSLLVVLKLDEKLKGWNQKSLSENNLLFLMLFDLGCKDQNYVEVIFGKWYNHAL